MGWLAGGLALMLRLGYCVECSASYPSPVVTDGICHECQASEPTNDPTPFVDTDTDKYSRLNLRERLSVSCDVDE